MNIKALISLTLAVLLAFGTVACNSKKQTTDAEKTQTVKSAEELEEQYGSYKIKGRDDDATVRMFVDSVIESMIISEDIKLIKENWSAAWDEDFTEYCKNERKEDVDAVSGEKIKIVLKAESDDAVNKINIYMACDKNEAVFYGIQNVRDADGEITDNYSHDIGVWDLSFFMCVLGEPTENNTDITLVNVISILEQPYSSEELGETCYGLGWTAGFEKFLSGNSDKTKGVKFFVGYSDKNGNGNTIYAAVHNGKVKVYGCEYDGKFYSGEEYNEHVMKASEDFYDTLYKAQYSEEKTLEQVLENVKSSIEAEDCELAYGWDDDFTDYIEDIHGIRAQAYYGIRFTANMKGTDHKLYFIYDSDSLYSGGYETEDEYYDSAALDSFINACNN